MARTLILDAEAEACELIRRVLEGSGHQVVAFVEAEKALNWARYHPLDMAIVSLDVAGPGANDVWRALKEISRNLKVLVVSRLANKKLAREAVDRGAEDHLLKPFDLEELEAKVMTLLQL
jgi:DNA-binding response OmpR family regulator